MYKNANYTIYSINQVEYNAIPRAQNKILP